MRPFAPRPLPGDLAPDNADQPFWDACARGEFLIQRCGACGRAYWPAGACPHDGAASMSWVRASGAGSLHTWTVVHQRYPNSFEDGPATNVAVIRLDEGPFFHSKVVDCPSDELHVGMPVHVTFRSTEPGLTLPVFVPSAQ